MVSKMFKRYNIKFINDINSRLNLYIKKLTLKDIFHTETNKTILTSTQIIKSNKLNSTKGTLFHHLVFIM